MSPALLGDEGDPVFASGHDPDAERGLRRKDERRTPADDHALTPCAQGLEHPDEAPEVRHLGNVRRAGKRLDRVHQPASASLVVVFHERDIDIEVLGQFLHELLVINRPVQAPADLARHRDAAGARLAAERDREGKSGRTLRRLCAGLRRVLGFRVGEGMGLLAEPGDGFGKVLGCCFLVHGILPPKPQSILTRDGGLGLKTTASAAARQPAEVESESGGHLAARLRPSLVGYPTLILPDPGAAPGVGARSRADCGDGLSRSLACDGNVRRALHFRKNGQFVLYNCHFPLESRSHLCENSWKRARKRCVTSSFLQGGRRMAKRPSIRGTESARIRPARLAACLAVGIGLLLAAGCTRTYYHDFADRDTYGILRERLFDWRWRLPPRPVEADPKSRMADFADPNYEPIPPDEPAARDFQISNRFPFEYHGWKKRGTAPVEYLDWQKNIPIESDGKVLLSRDSIMRLAITNSRDYQTNYEQLYLAALDLTQARFQFMVQGFSTSGWLGQIQGFGKTQNDQLQLSTLNGFKLELMTGAQMLVSLANSLVFNYTGKGFEVASPNLLINFTQPLLRGAWARIVTQTLSLQERGVLYALRTFAHYRRTFYVGLVAGSRLSRTAEPASVDSQPGADRQVVCPQQSAIRGRVQGRIQVGDRAPADRLSVPAAIR